jgi:hypothetical protein
MASWDIRSILIVVVPKCVIGPPRARNEVGKTRNSGGGSVVQRTAPEMGAVLSSKES